MNCFVDHLGESAARGGEYRGGRDYERSDGLGKETELCGGERQPGQGPDQRLAGLIPDVCHAADEEDAIVRHC